MNSAKLLAAAALAAGCSLAMTSSPARAQVSVNIGVAPECPYGYYDVPPYTCAPAGYYGPQWFTGGVFIGAGPWFHGPANFHATVDNRFDPSHGYNGPHPARGEKAEPARMDATHFHGNEERDGRGHTR
jgi:hypothetical protein